jgi:hypothetical protein
MRAFVKKSKGFVHLIAHSVAHFQKGKLLIPHRIL